MIRCREIAPADFGAVADFLTHGFPGRSRNYWMERLQRQSERQAPAGLPRFGYMVRRGRISLALDANGHVKGLAGFYRSRSAANTSRARSAPGSPVCRIPNW
jgi:hypothetical protein